MGFSRGRSQGEGHHSRADRPGDRGLPRRPAQAVHRGAGHREHARERHARSDARSPLVPDRRQVRQVHGRHRAAVRRPVRRQAIPGAAARAPDARARGVLQLAAVRGGVPGSRTRRWNSGSEIAAYRQRRIELFIARRYFQLSPDEWDALPWDIHRAYLDGLQEDGTLTREEGEAMPSAAEGGPQQRTAQTATDVISLSDMRAELEQRKRGEVT